jgi:hypothetical protein
MSDMAPSADGDVRRDGRYEGTIPRSGELIGEFLADRFDRFDQGAVAAPNGLYRNTNIAAIQDGRTDSC